MAMLQRLAAKFGPLPDAEFVVDTSDGYSHLEAPIFVIAKFPSWPRCKEHVLVLGGRKDNMPQQMGIGTDWN